MGEIITLADGSTIHISWWHVVILAVVVSGLSRLIATKPPKKSQEFYSTKLKQAPWSPPGWLFGPAWTFNNFFLLWALIKIIHLGASPIKTGLLYMQLFIWIIFYSFDFVYFNKKSPILAAIWTKSDFLLALISFMTAWGIDLNLAFCYAPLTLWTGFAGTVAIYQALYNGDPVFRTRPVVEYLRRKK